LPFFHWQFPNLLFWEPVVGIVVEMDETAAAGKVDVVVAHIDTGWVCAFEHFPAGPSRKNLDDFSIQDCMYWSTNYFASEN
jgi:hypothetical protein